MSTQIDEREQRIADIQAAKPMSSAAMAHDMTRGAMALVEESGAHPLLTDAVVALSTAHAKLKAFLILPDLPRAREDQGFKPEPCEGVAGALPGLHGQTVMSYAFFGQPHEEIEAVIDWEEDKYRTEQAMKCDCGATTDGKYAGMHTDGCACLKERLVKLVDVEPTPAMIEKALEVVQGDDGRQAYLQIDGDAGPYITANGVAAIYRAMTQASPQPADKGHWLGQSRGEE